MEIWCKMKNWRDLLARLLLEISWKNIFKAKRRKIFLQSSWKQKVLLWYFTRNKNKVKIRKFVEAILWTTSETSSWVNSFHVDSFHLVWWKRCQSTHLMSTISCTALRFLHIITVNWNCCERSDKVSLTSKWREERRRKNYVERFINFHEARLLFLLLYVGSR